VGWLPLGGGASHSFLPLTDYMYTLDILQYERLSRLEIKELGGWGTTPPLPISIYIIKGLDNLLISWEVGRSKTPPGGILVPGKFEVREGLGSLGTNLGFRSLWEHQISSDRKRMKWQSTRRGESGTPRTWLRHVSPPGAEYPGSLSSLVKGSCPLWAKSDRVSSSKLPAKGWSFIDLAQDGGVGYIREEGAVFTGGVREETEIDWILQVRWGN